MATKTRAQMVTKVLQRLGVLAVGQSPTAEDSSLVGEILDSVHAQYVTRKLAPFATSAFPEWSQEPFAKIIAAEAGPYFGFRDLPMLRADAAIGDRDLAAQLRGQYGPAVTFRGY